MRGLIENGESETWRPYALGQRSGLSRPYDRYSEVQRQQVSVQTHDWKCIFHGDTPFALIDRSREYERLENVLDRAPAGVLEKMREHMAEAWS